MQPPNDNRVILAVGAGLAILAAVVLALVFMGGGDETKAPEAEPAEPGALSVDVADAPELAPTRELRCFVDGQFVGMATLADCAELLRNAAWSVFLLVLRGHFTDPASRDIHVPDDHAFLSRMYAAGLRGIVALRGPGSRAAELAERVADELVANRMATAVIDDLVSLGRATATVEHSHDLSAEVILAQVRSIIADLLALCGMDPLEATDVIPLR